MTFLTERDLKMRAKLQAKIDQQDAERGRPLTSTEQLVNLQRALETCFACDGRVTLTTTVCPYCGQRLQ
jgi:hypothetical protein